MQLHEMNFIDEIISKKQQYDDLLLQSAHMC